MHRISALVFTAAATTILACDRSTAPDISAEVGRFTLVPIDIPGASILAVGVTEDGTVIGDAYFGLDSSGVFRWKNGTFTFRRAKVSGYHSIASNNLGDVVGVFGDSAGLSPAVWYVEDSVPRPMTDADTAMRHFQPSRINDHREVAVWKSGATGIWYAGQFANSRSTACYPESLNDQGVEVIWGCVGVGGGGPATTYASPFRTTPLTNSARLAGRECTIGQFWPEAVNDSNEALGRFGPGGASVWRAGGCIEFPEVFEWVTFNSRGLLLGIANHHICANRALGSICGDGLLLNEHGSAELDALIDAPAGSWTIAMHEMVFGNETKLTDSKLILTQAQLNNGPLTWVLLVPSH